MSKRYYYTCPIKALYMMREFEVEFDIKGINNFVAYMKNPVDGARINVATKSQKIFKPKKGDEGRWLRPIGAHYANYNGEQWVSAGIEPNPPEIIIRDNKQFFMPEVEND